MNDLIVMMLIGAPGCGKTTWGKNFANSHPNFIRVCPDEFRAIYGTGESDQTVSNVAFSATKTAMENSLALGKSVIVDATNMYRKTRKYFLKPARLHGAKLHAVVFECNKQTLMERNKMRGDAGGRNVPESGIDDMLRRYQRPDKTEFDIIQFISKE